MYITTITTHRHSRGCDSRSTKTFPKAREACRAQGDRQASMQRKLTSERLQGEEAATMLFPSQRKAVRVQSSEMHKLALIDNCTQVLLPTQASSSALASTQQPCNSHASQPPDQGPRSPCGAQDKTEPRQFVKSVEHSSPQKTQTKARGPQARGARQD